MASVIDSAIMVGRESTYGTSVTPTRSYEGHADSWKREQEYLESVGFRAGLTAMRSDRRRPINMGGVGELEVDVLDKGWGLLLQASLGSIAGPTQIGATTAYTSTATATTADPDDSFTVQVQRVDVGGTVRAFTHLGSVITGWTLTQDVAGLLVFKANYDFQDVVTNVAAATNSYPAGIPFDWSQAAITINGSAVDAKKFELSAELGLNTDRRFLRASPLKKKPIRSAMPSFTGTVEMEFESLTQYGLFTAGTIVAITATWTGSLIAGGNYATVAVTLPACQIVGESPQANVNDLPTQAVPFVALDNGSQPAVTIAYTSTDTTL